MQKSTGLSLYSVWCLQSLIGLLLLVINLNELDEVFNKSNLESIKFFTYDSIYYKSISIYISQNFNILKIESLSEIYNIYGTNTIFYIIGSIIYNLDGYSNFIIFMMNIFILGMTYQNIKKISKYFKLNESTIAKKALILLYTPFSLTSFNKEIFGFLFITVLATSTLEIKRLYTSFFVGAIRIQYLVNIIMYYLIGKNKYCIINLLIIINIIVILNGDEQIKNYYSLMNNGGIYPNSQFLFLILNEYSDIPVIGIITNVITALINLLVGICAPINILINIINSRNSDLIMLTSIFLLSFEFIKFTCKIINSPKIININIKLINLIVIFTFINTLFPILQPRYYLPLYFIFIIFNEIKNEQKFNISHNTCI